MQKITNSKVFIAKSEIVGCEIFSIEEVSNVSYKNFRGRKIKYGRNEKKKEIYWYGKISNGE